ncbi:uncharacterized protein LOC136076593 [Hydra vulgaris]|uniref:Uncharacterized protein LOC136076593 n=1 Tax=Hydra vulgaris TaxID=6087 RepID=A0ABM4BAN9_HYDVU
MSLVLPKKEKAVESLLFHSNINVQSLLNSRSNKPKEKCLSRWKNVFIDSDSTLSKSNNSFEKLNDKSHEKFENKYFDLKKKRQSRLATNCERFMHYDNIDEYVTQYRRVMYQQNKFNQFNKEFIIKNCSDDRDGVKTVKSETIGLKSSFVGSRKKALESISCANGKQISKKKVENSMQKNLKTMNVSSFMGSFRIHALKQKKSIPKSCNTHKLKFTPMKENLKCTKTSFGENCKENLPDLMKYTTTISQIINPRSSSKLGLFHRNSSLQACLTSVNIQKNKK